MLAHSLRDAGTAKKLAVLVTLDSVSVEVVSQLKASSNGTKPTVCRKVTDRALRPCTTM